MLLEFSIKNFLSFKEKVTFSMIGSSDDTMKDNFVIKNNNKILNVSAIYGANASGKSNLFKALGIICDKIRQSNYYTPNMSLAITPFKLDNQTINEPSEFEIRFIENEIRYIYGFTVDSEKIYSEYLTYYPKGRPVKIFDRKNINEYTFNASDEKFLKDIKDKNTQNKFFIATATSWNFDKTKIPFDFITEKLWVVMSLDYLKNYSYDLYSKDNDKSLEKFALKFLKKADFNIKDYVVKKEANVSDEFINLFKNSDSLIFPSPFIYNVRTTHSVSGGNFEFDISEESMGTQVIFSLIPIFKNTLDNGKILIIDEFDRSLHPYLIKYIVELFNDPIINKNNAQLIFNTHDTNLLNLELLRRDQIWFTEKDSNNGESILYPLDDFSIRKSENVEKGYLLGRYGAVPFIESDFSDLRGNNE